MLILFLLLMAVILWITMVGTFMMFWLNGQISRVIREMDVARINRDLAQFDLCSQWADVMLEDFNCTFAHMLPGHLIHCYRKYNNKQLANHGVINQTIQVLN